MWTDASTSWWWEFGLLHMLLYWGVVILVFTVLIKWLFGLSTRSTERTTGSALDILKARYARGEIQKAEYDEKKRDLASG